MFTATNMTNLINGLEDLITAADNVANGKIGQAERDSVQKFSNLLHGNQPQTSVGFFDAMKKPLNPTSSQNLDA